MVQVIFLQDGLVIKRQPSPPSHLLQVQYLGLMENVRVRRAGYANRLPFDYFVQRYKVCCRETWPLSNGSDHDAVAAICRAVGLTIAGEDGTADNHDVNLGKTKIFISKAKTMSKLEDAREAEKPRIVLMLQCGWRRYRARKLLKQLRGVFLIKRAYKSYKVREHAPLN
jgi:myosin-1